MAHSISIKNETYHRIKEYCDINGLRINETVNEILHNALMTLLYGDIPFGVIGNSGKQQESEVKEIETIVFTNNNTNAAEINQDTNDSVEEKTIEEPLNDNTVIDNNVKEDVVVINKRHGKRILK